MSILVVTNIWTDADLADEVGGVERLDLIQPEIALRDKASQKTLDEMEESLVGRSPAILPTDLTDPKQLKSAGVYGTLVRLYRDAITGPDSVYALKKRDMEKLYSGAMSRSFKVSGGQRGPSGGSFRMERR